MTEDLVSLPTRDGPMTVHRFIPKGAAGPVPAVIVLQEAFGVNPHVRRVCRRVAGLGYAAFAPELFHRSGDGLEFGYDNFAAAKAIFAGLTNERILEDLQVTHAHACAQPFVDRRRTAAWGFCMGGWAAVLAACELPLAAAVSFYGGGMVRPRNGIAFTPILDRLPRMKAPVLLVYGALDPSIPQTDIDAVDQVLTANGKEHEIALYPEGGHGFFCEDRSAYHRDSAEAAWAHASAWLAPRLQ